MKCAPFVPLEVRYQLADSAPDRAAPVWPGTGPRQTPWRSIADACSGWLAAGLEGRGREREIMVLYKKERSHAKQGSELWYRKSAAYDDKLHPAARL